MFFNKLFRRSSDVASALATSGAVRSATSSQGNSESAAGEDSGPVCSSWDREKPSQSAPSERPVTSRQDSTPSTGSLRMDRRISATDSAFGGGDEVKRLDFLSELPFELAVQIACHLNCANTINRMLRVSQRWQRVALDDTVWRTLYFSKWWALPAASPSNQLSVATTKSRRAEILAHRRKLLQLPAFSPSSPSASYTLGSVKQIYRSLKRDWRETYRQRLKLDRNWSEGIVELNVLKGHTDAVYCVQSDNNLLVSGSRDKTMKFWDLRDMSEIITLGGHQRSVLCLQYNDKYIVSGSSDCTLLVWSRQSRKLLHVLRGHGASVLDVQINDKVVISCSKDCSIRIWDIATGQHLRTLDGHHAAVNAIHMHGDLVASASGDCSIRLWEVSTGRCIRSFCGHEKGLACVQFDGTYLVSGSNDQTIKVWNAITGECLRTLTGHEDLVRTLCFDRRRIVSGSYDQTIKVWDFETGKLVLNLTGAHKSWIFHVQMDNVKIISSSQDKTIVIWNFASNIDNPSDLT